jgi:hypothetical protein
MTPHRCDECDEISRRLAPHAARDAPHEDMEALGADLPLLSPKAFRYDLPRFIAFSLVEPDSSVAMMIDYDLSPSPTLDAGERNRFVAFTVEEGRVVREFVEHRACINDSEVDRPYLDAALVYWRGATG